MSLHALVEKWRDVPDGYATTAYENGYICARRTCAAELLSAMAYEPPVTPEDVRWLEDIHEALTEAGGPTNNMRAIAVRRAIEALKSVAP